MLFRLDTMELYIQRTLKSQRVLFFVSANPDQRWEEQIYIGFKFSNII